MSLVAKQQAGAGEWSPPRERWTIEDARRMAEAWRRSGEKVGTFARRHGVGAERVRWWLRRLEQQQQQQGSPQVAPVRFAPVRLVERPAAEALRREQSLAAQAGGLEVVIAGKRVIRVGGQFDPALLRQVVAALEELPC